MNTDFDYRQFTLLGDKVKSGNATTQERDEFMKMLFQNGRLTKTQYDDYLKNKNKNDIVDVGLAIGGIILIGYLLSELFGGSKK